MTRQKLPVLAGTAELARDGVGRGGYVLRRAAGEATGGQPDLILIATGSELHLATGAADLLEADGIGARVVSLPCWELFERQEPGYRAAVLPPTVTARLSVEAGVTLGWDRWVGSAGAMLGIDHFGASAPGATVLAKYGFTIERVAEIGRRVVREGLHGPVPTLDPGHQPPGLALDRPAGGDRSDGPG
jgi:transketolase